VTSLVLSARIELASGDLLTRMSALPDACADVVLSCYTLAYIAPEDLDAVLYEMGRLAKRAVILAEPMGPTTEQVRGGFSGYSEWAHGYQTALKWIGTLRECAATVIPVEPPVDRLNGVLVVTRK